MGITAKTEYEQLLQNNYVKLNYSAPREELNSLNGDLFCFLSSLRDNANYLGMYIDRLQEALPVFDITKDTPISKELGVLIMEKLFTKVNPLLHNLATIYVKIDGQQTCCEGISAIPEPIPPTGQAVDTDKDCDDIPTINLSLLARTEKSLSKLMTVCVTVEHGVMNDFVRNQLITSIAQISDNLIDLAQEFKITGQDLRAADHNQSDIIPAPVYPKPMTCDGHCNCNNKKG